MSGDMQGDVRQVIDSYPVEARERALAVRQLILDVAARENMGGVEETLKWNEPAYLVRHGSTVRMDWKAKNPDRLGLYFNCNTRLIDTFRALLPDVFDYRGNREISLPLDGHLAEEELGLCLSMALRYHRIKHLPMLGA